MVFSGLIALAVSAACMPLLIRLARDLRVEDRPDGKLKTHTTPTPVLGGTGIALGTAVAWAVSGHVIVPELACGLILAFVGFLDDKRSVAVSIRISIEVAIALLLYKLDLAFSGGPEAAVLSVLAVLGCVNALNMLDGLDGLAGGCSAIAAVAFAVLLSGTSGGYLAAAIIGATLGFLVFNFHPAKIFMGDSGSYFLGFSLCTMLFRLQREGGAVGLAVGLLILGPMVLDSSWAMVRRILAGRSPFDGDRLHAYDRLRDAGLSVPLTAVAMYAISAIFAGVGIVAAMSL